MNPCLFVVLVLSSPAPPPFLQRWLLTDRTEDRFLTQYDRAMEDMMSTLVKRSKPSGLAVRWDNKKGVIHEESPPSCSGGLPVAWHGVRACFSLQIMGSKSDGDSPSMNQLACFVPGMLALGVLHADGEVLAHVLGLLIDGGGGMMCAGGIRWHMDAAVDAAVHSIHFICAPHVQGRCWNPRRNAI
jgi:hypothetical protein